MSSSFSTELSSLVVCRPNTLVELLRGRAIRQRERVAYTFLLDGEAEERNLTYGELDEQARAVAAMLQAAGAAGKRVLLLYPSGLEYVCAFFGCLYAGAVAVPAYPPRLNRSLHRLQAVVDDAQATLALTTKAILGRVNPMLAEATGLQTLRWLDTDELDRRMADEWREPAIDGSTLAFLQYTSGSTSTPKGVLVTHDNLLHNEEMISSAFKQTGESVIAGWLPLYHDMGLIGNVLQPLYLNARCILMSPTAFLQRPVRWLQAISRYRATTSGGPNFAYELCVNKVTKEQRASLDLSSWSVAFNGAEPVRSETLERFAETFAACGFRREAFQPCYGLAEATLIVSGGLVSGQQTVMTVQAKALESNLIVEVGAGEEGARSLVGCGRALLDQEIVIVHPESLERCAPAEVGEIWVKGPSIAAGYWGRSEETEHTFRARLADSGEGPFLRTGDLGALIGGELFVTGRLKDLLIIRGRNHYPQDIELSVERSHAALRPGCGAAFSVAADGEEMLVIVYELDRRQHGAYQEVIDNVRQAVSEEHEVQVGAIVLIKAGTLPKTSSGKIQRTACRAAFLASELSTVAEWRHEAGAESETAAPPDATRPQSLEEIQSWLLSHLAASLRIDPSGIDVFQPVTRYGLDSLVAIELVHSIENKLGVTLPMASLLQSSSIAELAAQALAQLAAGSAQAQPAVAAAAEFADEHPLSYGQRALWFLHQLAPESAAYNLSFAARVRSALDVAVLRRSMQVLVDRHPSLRTTFEANQDEPIQRVHARAELSFREEDAALWNATELQERMAEESRRPFNLERGPLLRVVLFKLPAQEHLMLITAHHIVADSWSLGVLAHELGLVYESECNGVRAPLAPLPLQYGDYARRQADALAGLEGERLRAYWQKQLGGELPLLNLPTDRQRPPLQTYRGASHHFMLDGSISQALKKLGLANDATLYMVLLAAFQALLHRYTGQQDILVGSPTTGRSRSDLAGLIGYFVNPLVMRADFSAQPTFAELLRQVRQTVLNAFEHHDYPFPLLVEQLQPERDPSRSPLFQAMFILHKAHLLEHHTLTSFALGHAGVETMLGGLLVESVALKNEVAQFDVTLMLAEEGGSLAASLEYNTDLFDEATIARLAGHYRMLLESIVTDPRQPVSALPILTAPERRQLLVDWNRTEAEYTSSQTIHQLFEAQAQKTPKADALVCGHERLSYSELNRRANQLAHYLRRLGVGPEVRVGVCLERTADLLVALLGVLKAGGAYIPLDPSYPKERVAFMLEDGQAAVLLTQSHLLARLPEQGRRVVCLDETRDEPAHENVEDLTPTATPDNLAYVIYTSGSTGRPKGVAIAHRSALAMIDWSRGLFTAEDLAGMLASTSICFDLSIFELFLPLAGGHKIILADNVLCLAKLPAAAEVTLINTVPSAMTELLRMQEIPASVKVVNLAGEALPNHLVQQIYQRGAVEKVFNLYGPSEDTTYSTVALIKQGSDEAPPIGRPISNSQAYVLDSQLNPTPIGVPCELYVGGAGLARGYLNRPSLTAERFVPNPFSCAPGARLYRTGDLVRYSVSGELQYLGRIDQQVKIRGFRIELGEVEAALNAQAGVRECVVVVREEVVGEKRLVAYVVAEDGGLSAPALRVSLRERLPEYMVPSALVVLDSLPLTPNGKVDRKALPAPDRQRPELEKTFVAPKTETEEVLAGIFAGVLRVERVGVNDNFFELGGHSLLATQVISRVRNLFRIELPLNSIFECPSVTGLAGRVEKVLRGGQDAPPSVIERAPRDGHLPLSFAQQRLWFIDQLDPNNFTYNFPSAVRLTGPLDIEALEQSFNELIRRHESLRTSFVVIDGQPGQVIAPELSLHIPVVSLEDYAGEACQAEVRRLASEEAETGFDLQEGMLLRLKLLRLKEDEHVLLFTTHHIVSDGWSVGVMVQEVAELYDAFSELRPVSLPDLPIQYADYAIWQRQWLTGEALDRQLSYWKERLAGAPPVLELPTDRPRPKLQSFRGATLAIELPRELTEDLEALTRRRGVTLYMTLLAAFQTLLHRYTGEDDISVGSPIAGRNRAELEPLVGFFVNTLVMRTDLSGDPTFGELLKRVREMALGAYANQDVPFERLVEELQPARSLSHTPLFQVAFALQNTPRLELRLRGVAVEMLDATAAPAKFDLMVNAEATDGGLQIVFTYAAELFDKATIERMAGHFRLLLEAVATEADRRLSELPLLSSRERQLVLEQWAGEERPEATGEQQPGTSACAHQLFEAQAEKRPAAVAIVSGAEQLSYAELNKRANAVAHYLIGRGVGPESLVGVMMKRTSLLVEALLGVLKAGGAYVPFEPGVPAGRLRAMVTDAEVRLVLTQESLRSATEACGAEAICLDSLLELLDSQSKQNPAIKVAPENLAYVIYTSGSTGVPKGVEVQHKSLSNLVDWHQRACQLTPNDRATLVAGSAFDASVLELWPYLSAGASIYLPDEVTRVSAPLLLKWLAEEKITVSFLPTPLAEVALEEPQITEVGLRFLLTGGDQLRRRPRKEVPFRFINLYGPTEYTVVTTSAEVNPGTENDPLPSIGRPITNTGVYLLDGVLDPVPIGFPGELYVGGAGLARGYLNRPQLTAEHFIPHPFSSAPGARLYRTGDLVRYSASGELQYLGRMDQQVKLRGFRIELGEVEAALGAHPGVRECVVLAREDVAGDKRLVAYVVCESEGLSMGELRAHLRERLPEYMTPSALVVLEALPLTPNGKVDRKALPAPDGQRSELEKEFVAPRTQTEEVLAGIWSEVLGVEKVGVEDNFFELGGHSLLATQLILEVRKAFQVDISLRQVFETPTVAYFAELIEQSRAEGQNHQVEKIQAKPRRGKNAGELVAKLDELSPEEVKELLLKKRLSRKRGFQNA